MTGLRLTISKAISKFTPQEFYDYVKRLYRVTESTTKSKAVPKVNLNWIKSGNCIVKIEGEKSITDVELELLCVEYAKSKELLTELLTKRKVKILNAETGEQLNVTERKPRKKRAKKDVATDERTVGEIPL